MAKHAKGLDSRSRDKDGQIHEKRGDTLVRTLRKHYGQDFAPGVRGDMKLASLLKKENASSLSDLVKKHRRDQKPIKIRYASVEEVSRATEEIIKEHPLTLKLLSKT